MKLKFSTFFFLVFFLGCGKYLAQSTVQDFPTSVTSNEIVGKINARDIGDSRLTSYFYTFNGTQGDLFINVETNNLNADFDIFTISDLRPLTKIVVYAGSDSTETGRVIFLRKNEKLLLRIKGRTPNDDAGTYKIKFAGSFEAISNGVNNEIELPTVKKQEETDVKVNSVGTIIEVKPKPTPDKEEKVAEKEETEKDVKKTKSEPKEITQTPQSVSTTGKKVSTPKKPKSAPKPKEKTDETKEVKEEKTEVAEKPKKEKVIKPKRVEEKTETAEVVKNSDSKEKTETEKKTETKEKTVAKAKQPKPVKPKVEKTPKTESETEVATPKSLENIKLIVLFKDGTKFERKMSEVNNVGINNGNLTIITNKGEVLRYSILEVEKMTIE